MKIELTIPTKILRAAALFAAGEKEKTRRFWLVGVFVKVENGTTAVVGCDGATMGVFEGTTADACAPDFEAIIPLDHVKVIAKHKGDMLALTYDTDEKTWTCNGLTFAAIDGKYPPYKRVCARHVREQGGYTDQDVELLHRFAAANKVLGCRAPGQVKLLFQGKGASARVLLPQDFIPAGWQFYGTIMPFNNTWRYDV